MSIKLKQKVLIICGPTGVGKTALGVSLAKIFNGEIISADSRQIYKGMDIATGKDIENAKIIDGVWHMKGIPIYLIDIKKPTEEFSVAEFKALAQLKIKEILARQKLPIIVGGTGFYIQSLTKMIDTIGIPPNIKLRKKLSIKTVDELFMELNILNSDLAKSLNESERKNKQRLIRRIEIANATGFVYKSKKRSNYDFLTICLSAERNILKERIIERIDKWFMNGAKKEVEKLLNANVSWNNRSMGAIGYKQWRSYFENTKTESEVLQDWKNKEWRYATQQLTWLKKHCKAYWFDISDDKFQKNVEDLITNWYTRG